MDIPIFSESQNPEQFEYLLWIGCAGAFDARAQKVTRAFSKLLLHAGVSFAILGNEEQCSGDPARRAGNEFVFQMLALQNIETMKQYNVQKILTTCPHCYNTFKNEYPALGGNYEVFHHTTFLEGLMESGKIKVSADTLKGKKVTYHDSCYLGRINGEYDSPRNILKTLTSEFRELPKCRSNAMCCGAGGAQMFKEEEEGAQRVNEARAEEVKDSKADVLATNCPFCLTMMEDGMKAFDHDMPVYDISELILSNIVKD